MADDTARVEAFIAEYNKLRDFLATKAGIRGSQYPSFPDLIDQAAQKSFPGRKALDEHRWELRTLADLRNAIEHSRDAPRRYAAIPTPETVASIQTIVEAIMRPMTVFPKFQRTIRMFQPTDRLAEALAYMRNEKFSQVVVREGEDLTLLTVEGVSGWLQDQSFRNEGVAELADATIKDARAFDLAKPHALLGKNATVDEARGLFAGQPPERPRVYAILITQNGRPQEKPLGIVTPWDVAQP